MSITATPDLSSARAIFDRAKVHHTNFRELTGRGLWEIEEVQDDSSGKWRYTLRLHRDRLIAARPILADCANNLASVLDNVAAAMARAKNPSCKRGPYFPFRLDEQDFIEKLDEITSTVGAEMARIIAENHSRQKLHVPHMKAAKDVANKAKHWELMTSQPSAHGIGVDQHIFQIPEGAFKSKDLFEFHHGSEKLPPVSMSLVNKLEITGLADKLPNSPDMIVEGAFQYVDGLINAVSTAKLTSNIGGKV